MSVWLPSYYQHVYGLSLGVAAMLTALFIFPASLLRPLGGYFSDRFGARRVMYWVFGSMTAATLLLSLPPMRIEIPATHGVYVMTLALNVWSFTLLVLVVAAGMGIGKAAVYKYIPQYFPRDIGAVGGLVGMLGALGGFVLTPMFAYLDQLTGLPQTTFFVLLLITALSLLWLHVTVVRILRREAPHVRDDFEHPVPGSTDMAAPAICEVTPAPPRTSMHEDDNVYHAMSVDRSLYLGTPLWRRSP